jgi:hypothetical protein
MCVHFQILAVHQQGIKQITRITDMLINITVEYSISLEIPVPSQGPYVFTVFRLLTDFVCLYNYEF